MGLLVFHRLVWLLMSQSGCWYWWIALIKVHSPCDERNITLISYEWISPRICRDDVPSAVKLPAGSERRKCPPCSPGMQMNYKTGKCQFCPIGSISDGIRPCHPCPPSTAANTGLQFLWWNHFPPGMSARCMSIEGTRREKRKRKKERIRTDSGLCAYLL